MIKRRLTGNLNLDKNWKREVRNGKQYAGECLKIFRLPIFPFRFPLGLLSNLRRVVSCFLALGAILSWQSCQPGPKEKAATARPNIVLIMADDLGYGGIGCYGNQVLQTPHLDQLAAEGLRFTDFHSNGAVCSPTRAALLTGRYQQRAGLEGVIYVKGPTRQIGLDSSEQTMAKLLKANGYATGIFGKWHLGYAPAFNPVHHGFDEFYGYLSGNVDYHSHYDNAGIYDWWHNLDSIQEEGYSTDLITTHAVDFIKAHQDEPFFVYVPHESPHVPFQGRNDPGFRFPDNEFTYQGPVTDTDRAYIEMVEVMDEGIGVILQTLKDLHLEENTLVLFISDNGAEAFGHNGALNGDKGHLLEGGHRVPAIAYWKGKIQAGVSDETIMSFDWLPTFLALSNSSKPTDVALDGIDLSPLLLQGQALPQRNLYWRYRKESAIRQNQYKLWVKGADTLLFDLQQDLAESQNIAAQHPTLVQELAKALHTWESDMNKVTQKAD